MGGSLLDESLVPRALGRLHPAVHAELAVETLNVRLDGVDLDIQRTRNPRVGLARRQQPKYLELAFRQRVRRD
ncbi:MAG: hypothetical protein JWO59_3380 [Chloroflexi bacterium]|nr:hypothetical protein [Chloroflexota bacterium]